MWLTGKNWNFDLETNTFFYFVALDGFWGVSNSPRYGHVARGKILFVWRREWDERNDTEAFKHISRYSFFPVSNIQPKWLNSNLNNSLMLMMKLNQLIRKISFPKTFTNFSSSKIIYIILIIFTAWISILKKDSSN